MFGALKALVNSEKAVVVGLLILGATAMVFTDRITTEQWIDYTEIMAGLYIGGKTVQGAVAVMAARRASPAAPDEGNPGT